MVDPKPKLELPCPRCGMLNLPAALRCRQCAQELEATAMPDWPQPAPFDLPGATVPCAACGKPNGLAAVACSTCGEPVGDAWLEGPASSRGTASKGRPRPRRRSGPVITGAGWARMAWAARLVAAGGLLWGVLDGAFWLNSMTSSLAPGDHAAATRYTTHAIYELMRNVVLVASVWLLAKVGPLKDA